MNEFLALSTGSHRPQDPLPGNRVRAKRRLLVLVPLAAILWGFTGFLGIEFADPFRLMLLVGEHDRPSDGGLADSGALWFVGFMSACIASFVVSWNGARVFNTFKSGTRLANAAGSGGIAIGLLLGSSTNRWTAPEAVGPLVGTNDRSPWLWPVHAATWLLPLTFALLAAFFSLWLVRSGGRARWTATKTAEIREFGVKLPGFIDRVEVVGTSDGGDPRFEITVTYIATFGPRQTTQRFVAPETDAPARGGSVDVWYDPTGDESTVLIELTPNSSKGFAA